MGYHPLLMGGNKQLLPPINLGKVLKAAHLKESKSEQNPL